MTKPSAGAAIIEAAKGAVSEIAAAAPAQLELLPAGADPATRRGQAIAELHRRDRAGRPEGSENKTTKEIKDICRKLFGDPMLESFRYAAHTPESLALLLGCSKLEAFDRLEKIRADLRRFYYPALAPVDGDTGKAVPFFQMLMGGQHVHVGGARPPWMEEGESEENQGVASLPAPVSHGEKSHGEDK